MDQGNERNNPNAEASNTSQDGRTIINNITNDYGEAASTINGAVSGAMIGSAFGPVGAVIGGLSGGAVGNQMVEGEELENDITSQNRDENNSPK